MKGSKLVIALQWCSNLSSLYFPFCQKWQRSDRVQASQGVYSNRPLGLAEFHKCDISGVDINFYVQKAATHDQNVPVNNFMYRQLQLIIIK